MKYDLEDKKILKFLKCDTSGSNFFFEPIKNPKKFADKIWLNIYAFAINIEINKTYFNDIVDTFILKYLSILIFLNMKYIDGA